MKILKTYEGYTHKDREEFPYPIYHEALLNYLPSSFLFSDYSDLPEYNYMQRFAADISDFINLIDVPQDEKYDKGIAFAGNAFGDDGIDFLLKVETQAKDRFDKILVGGIPTPQMGGRDPEHLDVHGDTLFFFGEDSESNREFLEELCEHWDELDYYDDGYYRVWWD